MRHPYTYRAADRVVDWLRSAKPCWAVPKTHMALIRMKPRFHLRSRLPFPYTEIISFPYKKQRVLVLASKEPMHEKARRHLSSGQ